VKWDTDDQLGTYTDEELAENRRVADSLAPLGAMLLVLALLCAGATITFQVVLWATRP
jgi:hypothetical protein